MFIGCSDTWTTRAEMRLLEQIYLDKIPLKPGTVYESFSNALYALKQLFVIYELFALEQKREGIEHPRNFFIDEEKGICIIDHGEGQGTSKIEIVETQ